MSHTALHCWVDRITFMYIGRHSNLALAVIPTNAEACRNLELAAGSLG